MRVECGCTGHEQKLAEHAARARELAAREGADSGDLRCPPLDERTCARYPAYFYGKGRQFSDVKASQQRPLEEPQPAAPGAPADARPQVPAAPGQGEAVGDAAKQPKPAEEAKEKRPEEATLPAEEASPGA